MIDLARWPALILCAGHATRLRPLSHVRAKAALPVGGGPLIARILEWLRGAGVRRAVINLHHRPETITRIVGDGSPWGIDVRYSWERELLGSAGGPARALPLLAADRFFVINGDTLSAVSLPALAEQHLTTGAHVTMSVVPADLKKYNALLTDAEGAVVGHRKRDGSAAGRAAVGASTLPDAFGMPDAWHFIGIQALNAAALAGIDPDRASETVGEHYPRLMAARPGSVRVFPSSSDFFDIGTPSDYLATLRRICAREGRPLDRGIDCGIAKSAEVISSVLWDRVRIGPGAVVRDCVVADDVEIPAGMHCTGCAIIRDGRNLITTPLA
jgi:NDP-sugar pyrophosphorylase family protein